MANIIKNSATKWNRKARLNVESMLHIGTGKSVTIPHAPQYELATYSISFFASVNSTFSITKGAFNFTQADLPSLKLGETALITITSSGILKNGIYLCANDKIFNNQNDLELSGDFLIGHLAIFGKEISQQEIEFIHGLGGVMPESTHASCVGHWPFTQRYGKTAWDVVEQYNYAKGYLVKSSPPLQSEYEIIGSPIITTGSDEQGTYIQLDASEAFKNPENEQGIRKTGNIYLYDGVQYIASARIKFVTEGTVTKFGVNFGGSIVLRAENYEVNEVANVGFNFKHAGQGGLRRPYFTFTTANSSPLTSSIRLYELYFYENGKNPMSANHASLINYTDLDAGIPDPSTNTAWVDFYKKTPIDWIGSVDGDGNIIEKESGLPEIKNALKFDGVGNYLRVPNFNPSKEKGYTIITGWALDEKRGFRSDYKDSIISKRGEGSLVFVGANVTNIYVYTSASRSRYYNYNPLLCDKMHSHSFILDDVVLPKTLADGYVKLNAGNSLGLTGFDEIETDMHIGRDTAATVRFFKGYISIIGIWKGQLSQKDILSLTNNTLLSNIGLLQDCQLLVDFAKPIDDTATSGKYKLKDLSPQNHDIFMEGFTANQLNAAHADYAFKPINDLR